MHKKITILLINKIPLFGKSLHTFSGGNWDKGRRRLSKREVAKGGIMIYTLRLLATAQKYTIRAIVWNHDHQDFITDYYHHWKVFGLSIFNNHRYYAGFLEQRL